MELRKNWDEEKEVELGVKTKMPKQMEVEENSLLYEVVEFETFC